jgi:hypothetical protein
VSECAKYCVFTCNRRPYNENLIPHDTTIFMSINPSHDSRVQINLSEFFEFKFIDLAMLMFEFGWRLPHRHRFSSELKQFLSS